MKKYILYKRLPELKQQYVGVFEATDIKAAKSMLRVSEYYGSHFISIASDTEIAIQKHFKVIPKDFNLDKVKLIKL